MKQGTHYASRIKKAFAQLRQQVVDPEIPEPTDPLHQLVIATFAVAYGQPAATKAIRALLARMAGWNEVRVSRPEEINRAMRLGSPDPLVYCQRIVDVLEGVYERENTLSLNRLKQLGRREARQYLDELPGVDEYGTASVTLWSLGGHGIPVDDALLKELREADLVHPEASRAEVQAFLERHVNATDAKAFCIIMRDFKAPAPAKPKKVKKTVSRKKKKKTTAKKKGIAGGSKKRKTAG